MKFFVFFIALIFLLNCKDQKKYQKKEEPEIEEEKDVSVIKSEFDEINESSSNIVRILQECKDNYIKFIDSSKIDRRELPVNIVEMDKLCRNFVKEYYSISDKMAGKYFEYDLILLSIAEITDYYSILSFKCKRIEMKEKEVEKLKKNINDFKETLMQSIDEIIIKRPEWERTIKKGLKEYKDMSVEEILKGPVKIIIEEIPSAFEYFAYIPGKKEIPTMRESLKVRLKIADEIVGYMNKRAVEIGFEFVEKTQSLVQAFRKAVKFYTGDYFDTVEKMENLLKDEIQKAFEKWKKSGKKLLDLFNIS